MMKNAKIEEKKKIVPPFISHLGAPVRGIIIVFISIIVQTGELVDYDDECQNWEKDRAPFYSPPGSSCAMTMALF